MRTSQRLCYRRFEPTDGPALHAYLSDEEVVRYEPYDTRDLPACQYEAEARADNDVFWAVCLRGTGALIGNVTLTELSYDTWELGYAFNRAYWKQGYATEAAQQALCHVFEDKKAHRMIAMCDVRNEASWRLMERLGMRREGCLIKNVYFKENAGGQPLWIDSYEYALLAQEWRR